MNLYNLNNLYIDYLDYGEKRIEAIRNLIVAKGKGGILKEGLIVTYPPKMPRLI